MLPRDVASGVLTTAVARGALGVAIAVIILAIPTVVDVLLARGAPEAIVGPALSLVGMLVLLVVMGIWPTNVTRIAFLVGGGLLSFAYGLALLETDPALNGDGSFILNRPLFALVLVGGAHRRPLAGFLWSLAGFVIATGVGLATALIAGVAFVPGWAPLMALGISASAYLALALIHSTQQRHVPDLAKLERDTRRLALESEFEQRAAAIVHDTVLSDLTVVMNSPDALDDRARARLRADVATLADPSWLRESGPAVVITGGEARLRNAMVTLVSEYQWRGLTVDVANTSDVPVLLEPEEHALIVAAVAACLENVYRHAGTSKAELILSTTESLITAMVVDDGIGFDPEAVPSDRLGIRFSIVQRIESIGGSVRVFSQPGRGTSVSLQIPNGRAVPDAQ